MAGCFKPIKKLLDMNDVAMPWKRIYATFPEQDNVPDSRGWTRAEMARMPRFASGTTDRALVLLAASSGMRMGGFDLDWGDMKPVYRGGAGLSFEGSGEPSCAMISVYRGTSSQYPAFVTPEACRALADHRESWATLASTGTYDFLHTRESTCLLIRLHVYGGTRSARACEQFGHHRRL